MWKCAATTRVCMNGKCFLICCILTFSILGKVHQACLYLSVSDKGTNSYFYIFCSGRCLGKTLCAPLLSRYSHPQHCDTTCGGFPRQAILTLTRVSADPTGEGLGPTSLPPLQTVTASSRFPGYPHLLSNVSTNRRFPWPPSLDFILSQSGSQNAGKHLHWPLLLYDKGHRWTAWWRDT